MEDKIVEIIQSKQQTEDKSEKMKATCEICGITCVNLCIIRVPEGEERKGDQNCIWERQR